MQIGFRQLDPFAGCDAINALAGEPSQPNADEGTDVLDVASPGIIPSTTTTRSTSTTRRTTTTTRRTTTTTPDRPYVYPTKPSVIGFNDDGQQITLTAASFPSRNSAATDNFVANSNSPSDLNLNDIPSVNNAAVQKIYDAGTHENTFESKVVHRDENGYNVLCFFQSV